MHERVRRGDSVKSARFDGWPIGKLLAVFVTSRVVYYAAGVRFDRSSLDWYFQFADPRLLRDEPLRTLWWFHGQPPAFNAYVAAVLQLPQRLWTPAFHGSFLVCGFALMVGIYALARELGVTHRPAFIIAVLISVSPTFVIYENWLFYPVPVATLLVYTFLGLTRYLHHGRPLWGAVGFGAAALLVLTRATYHVLWIAVLFVVVMMVKPQTRRRTMAVAALPLALCLGLYAKNFALFDSFSSSSWMGMNLAEMIQLEAPPGELAQLVASGDLEGPLDKRAFSPLDVYESRPETTGVAVLDQAVKPSGLPNYNNKAYIRISTRYLHDDLRYIKLRPGTYSRAIGRGFALSAVPATNQWFVQENVAPVKWLDEAFSRTVLLAPAGHEYPTGIENSLAIPGALNVSWTLVAIYGLVLIGIPVSIRRLRHARGDLLDNAMVLTAGLTILGALFLSNALELAENSRYRSELDPVAVVVAAVVLTWWRKARVQHAEMIGGEPEPSDLPFERSRDSRGIETA
jgi:hypothetical protein